MRLRAEPASAGRARLFIATTLDRWGVRDVETVVSLLTSELVTNAILHARSDLALVLRHEHNGRGDRLRVEVHDSSPVPPLLRSYTDDLVTGRGLALVESLSQRWGVEPEPEGKAVWFEVGVPTH